MAVLTITTAHTQEMAIYSIKIAEGYYLDAEIEGET